jgi:16S rRNA (uracil1498-N3)-methyltransferase
VSRCFAVSPHPEQAACRLFIEPSLLAAGPVVVRGDDYRYLFRVHRLRPGDSVALFDGLGLEAAATVRSVGPDHGVLAVSEPHRVAAPDCLITVIVALLKGERMDLCVQKLVELGVAAIIPIHTERTVVKLDGARARKRRDRFLDIARDAARQSRRARVPELHEITDLATALSAESASELKLVLWEREPTRSLRSLLLTQKPRSVSVLVGPEGGFTGGEIAGAVAAGFTPVSLGRHILRAETASIVAAATLGVCFGDLGD